MIATILKSETAVRRAVQIIRAFTELESHNITSITDLKEMMQLQNKIIVAINNQIQELGIKQNREVKDILARINYLEKRFAIESDAKQPISKQQATQLQELVKKKCKNRKQMMKIWTDFKRHFAIKKYTNLQEKDFEAAILWISKL